MNDTPDPARRAETIARLRGLGVRLGMQAALARYAGNSEMADSLGADVAAVGEAMVVMERPATPAPGVVDVEAVLSRLGSIADSLGPVAGLIMYRACQDKFEHEADCTCQTCRAFIATQQAQTDIEAVTKDIRRLLAPPPAAPEGGAGEKGEGT